MLASSANIPDNIVWENTTANTWALRGYVSLCWYPQTENPDKKIEKTENKRFIDYMRGCNIIL